MELTKKDQAIEKAQELFKQYAKDNYLKEIGENTYEVEVHFDYRDIEGVQETINSMNMSEIKTKDDLIYVLDDIFFENEVGYYETTYEKNNFLSEYEEELNVLSDSDDLFEFEIFDNIDVLAYIDYEDILRRIELNTVVFLENDESFNIEFSNNSFTDMFLFMDWEDKDEVDVLINNLKESSLNTLLESQGYSVEQMIEYLQEEEETILDNDSTFQSIVQEMNNAQNYQSLVSLMVADVNEFFEMKNADEFEVDNGTLGYFGTVDGSGSVLEVVVDKPFTLSKGQFKVAVDGEYGYSVSDVYGSFIA